MSDKFDVTLKDLARAAFFGWGRLDTEALKEMKERVALLNEEKNLILSVKALAPDIYTVLAFSDDKRDELREMVDRLDELKALLGSDSQQEDIGF